MVVQVVGHAMWVKTIVWISAALLFCKILRLPDYQFPYTSKLYIKTFSIIMYVENRDDLIINDTDHTSFMNYVYE